MIKKYNRNILITAGYLLIIIFIPGCNNPFLPSDIIDNEPYTSIFEDLNIPKDYELRIVLTWGSTAGAEIIPADFDSHLTGPNSDSSRFHCFYLDKGSQNSAPYALLDIDFIGNNGTEIVSIYQINSGTYRYSVHDYPGRESNSSTVLSASAVSVKVYRQVNKKDVLLYNFKAPNASGSLWKVFEYNGTNFTVINTMSYQSDPALIL